MIGVIDYGLGNVHAFVHIYRRLNMPVMSVRDPADVAQADKLILPGVGAFDWAMSRLEASGMRSAIEEAVMERNTPILGVCVGMQILASGSDEGEKEGLGWIPGFVRRLRSPSDEQLILPHMGWNDVEARSDCQLFSGMDDDCRFYFLHSYFFESAEETSVLSRTTYDRDFASAVGSGSVFGVQFHPEKSHRWGIRLLANFAEAAAC